MIKHIFPNSWSRDRSCTASDGDANAYRTTIFSKFDVGNIHIPFKYHQAVLTLAICKRYSYYYIHLMLTHQLQYASTSLWILISAPRLGVYYYFFVVDSVCLYVRMSVCLSVCHGQTSNWFFFLFLDRIEPFFGHQFYVTPSTKRCSIRFLI